MSRTVTIEGLRVRLRDWRLADLERMAFWLAPGQRWQELDAPYYPKPAPDDIPDLIAHRRAEIEHADLVEPRTSMAIADRTGDEMIGMVSRYWESQETNWLGIGIVLYDPASWRRGFGDEALGLWSDELFGRMPDLARLDLRTWSGNAGMMRLAEKLGYIEEARFRNARIVDGRFFDGLGYGVLREEWTDRYPDGFVTHLAGAEAIDRSTMS